MTRIFFIAILILISNFSFSQNYKIKGKIIDGDVLTPLSEIDLGFDFFCKTKTSVDGTFELTISDEYINDTLKIYLFNFYKLNIINFPKDSVINLREIKLYEYFTYHSMTTFDCGILDIICKLKEKKYWKKENKRINNYYKERNLEIEKYRLNFKDRFYAIDVEKNLIDLNKSCEK